MFGLCLFSPAHVISLQYIIFYSGMSLDESTYKNPTKFIPERFLSPPLGNGELHFSCLFGFGRRLAFDLFCDREKYSLTSEPDRKCPGVHFVERNLWIAIVSILATCTISNALDEHRNVIVPEASMSDGVDRRVGVVIVCMHKGLIWPLTRSSYPNDLRCVIKPRFKEVEALLEESILSPTT